MLISCPCNNDSAEFHQFFAGSYQDSTPRKPYCRPFFPLHTQAPDLDKAKHGLRSVTLLSVLAVFPKSSVHKLWTPLGSKQSAICVSYNKTLHPACHSSTDISTILNTARQRCSCPVSAVQILNNAKKPGNYSEDYTQKLGKQRWPIWALPSVTA